jgi:hypothetical protein
MLRRIAVISVAAVSVTAAAMTGAQADGMAAAQPSRMTGGPAAGAPCSRPLDVYQVAPSVLRSCGDTIEPLQRVTPLPGGGLSYNYGDYTLLVPPAHFNVLKASARRLAEYGFPSRHQLGKSWYQVMRHVRTFSIVPARRPGVPSATSTKIWAGYDVNDHRYTGVAATWTEPHFVAHGCSGDSFAQWAGIGGIKASAGNSLGQAGTTFNSPGFAAHQGFIETISKGQGPPVAVKNFVPKAGNKVLVTASWHASTKEFGYFLENEATGTSMALHSRKVSANLRTAEVISERPTTVNSLGHPVPTELSDFQKVAVHATASWASGSSGFFRDSHNAITMKNGSTTIAKPGTLSRSNSFTTTWKGCG